MAVSSTSSSTSGAASIDVASVVTQLMTVENKPLDAIKAKITQQQLIMLYLLELKHVIILLPLKQILLLQLLRQHLLQ